MRRLISAIVAAALVLSAGPPQARAQTLGVEPSHWAYNAVQRLADKGLVLGYPDGKFLGNRALTRYEMASIVQRILQSVEESHPSTGTATREGTANTAPEMTPEDLTTVKKLVDEYKVELTVIGADLKKVQDDLAQVKENVASMENDLEPLKSTVMDPEGTVQSMAANVNKMMKLKFSGYVQARWEDQQNGNANGTSTPKDSNFYIRRARLKSQADFGKNTTLIMQLDAGGTNRDRSVELKDAWLEYHVHGNADYNPTVTFGQMKWPFGYEVPQSSGDREAPERSDFLQALFPGERDRGIKISSPLAARLKWEVGLFNGVGINQGGGPWYSTTLSDNNNAKDLVGHVGYRVNDNLDVNFSGYLGKAGPDGQTQDKKRWGADMQWNGVSLPLSIRAEYVKATEPFGTTAATGTTLSQYGWYAQSAWSFSPLWTGIYKYDVYDDGGASGFGKRWNHQVGIIRWLDDSSRLKVFYEWKNEDLAPFKNNLTMVEWITKF